MSNIAASMISALFVTLVAGVPQPPPAALTQDSAMKMLYADYDTSRKAYVWKNPQIPDGLCDFQFYSGDSFVVTADKFWQIEEGGQQKAYLITSAQPDNPSWGAHTEAPLLSVSIFRRDRLNWRIDIQNSALGCFGTFGTAPPVGLLRWGA